MKRIPMRSSKPAANHTQVSTSLALLGTTSITVVLSMGWFYIIPSFSALSSTNSIVHPTSIPWLQNQKDCEKTGRIWQDGECWDQQHSPEF
jgi:hypothetical protein